MKILNIDIEIKKLNNSCFVAIPFSPLFKTEYETIIQPAILELDLECVRGDEIYTQQRIMDDIWSSLKSCRLVVAELTGRNPNVLYEIGLAHALGKPVIIITRNAEDVPFDLKDLRYLFYDVNDPFWGDNLKKGLQNLIRKVLENPEIGIYLQGIAGPKAIDFPIIGTHKTKKTEKTETILYDLSGIWKTSWLDNAARVHDMNLNLSQTKNELTGVGTVTFKNKGILSVVEQIFQGTISENTATLNGVNYSYIERGLSIDYFLDSFSFTINNNDRMIAHYRDDQGIEKMDIEFLKIINK